MATAQGISLYHYLYFKLAKTPCFSYFHSYFSLLQNQRTRGWNRFFREVRGGQKMYTRVSKCKNDKIIKRKNGLLVKNHITIFAVVTSMVSHCTT
jgi:hypothetical protein